jgi:hypothetical protein
MFDYATNQYVPPRFTNYVTGKVTDTVPKANVIVPEGNTDPLLGGLSYVQFARQGLALQKSQIGRGVRLAPAGKMDVGYHRYGSRLDQPDGDSSGLESGFFDGIDTTLPGIASLAPSAPAKLRAVLQLIDMHLADAQKQFDPANPAAVADPLRIALHLLDVVIAGTEGSTLPPEQKYDLLHELHIKRVQLNNALALAHGLTLTASVDDGVPGQSLLTIQTSLRVNAKLTTPARPSLKLDQITLSAPNDLSANAALPATTTNSITLPIQLAVPDGLPATRPYFSRPDIEQPFYDLSNPALRNAAATPNPLTVTAAFSDNDVPIVVAATVASQQTSDPRLAAVIVPPVSISVTPSVVIVTPRQQTFRLSAQLRNDASSPGTGTVVLRLSDDKPVDGGPQKFSLQQLDQQAAFAFTVPQSELGGHASTLSAIATDNQRTYGEGFRAVGYPGLTPTNYYTPSTYKAVPVDVTTAPNLNVAYIPGTGDSLPAALEQLGVHPHILDPNDLTAATLKPYNAVILGVRAYETHSDLAAANPALNQYAADGGIVIAQYNTGHLPEDTGPYPLNLGDGEKVVEENALVRILAPDNPLLTWPNHITSADFDNWIEERGHGFMGTWDPHYTALLETHDPGQAPQRGGLLVARTGRGAWIYLGVALYRQLPEGVPGSYRLLANLISAAKNPNR